jgi:hypothetical protein
MSTLTIASIKNLDDLVGCITSSNDLDAIDRKQFYFEEIESNDSFCKYSFTHQNNADDGYSLSLCFCNNCDLVCEEDYCSCQDDD